MRRLSFLLILLTAASGAFAQEARFLLWNAEENAVLSGARITQGADTTYTGVNGIGALSIARKRLPLVYEFFAPGYRSRSYTLSGVPKSVITITMEASSSGSVIPLGEAVITGLPTLQDRAKALASYRIISKDVAERQGAITLADALSTQANISINNDGILGATTTMLGMSGDKVKVLIDGMPVNGRENGNIDLGQLPLQNTARIEIVQGPMSIIYGTDAVGGVINLISATPKGKWSAGAELNYESVGRYNAVVRGSRQLGSRHRIALSGGRNFFDGWKYLDTSEPHRSMLFKPKEQYFGNATYNYTAPKGTCITAANDYVSEVVTNLGEAFITPFAGYAWDEYYHVRRNQSRLGAEGKLGKGIWTVSNSLALYHRVRERLVKDLVTLAESPTTGTGDQDTSRFTDLNLRGMFTGTLAGKLRYTLGYDVLQQWGESRKMEAGTMHVGDYALFGTATYAAWSNRATAQLGLRAAANTRYPPPVLPALSLLYDAPSGWQLRAAYGQAFRAPTLKEQYLQFVDQNHNITGNEGLSPETSHQVQASITRTHKLNDGDYLRGSLTAYYNDVRNQIALVNLRPDDSLSTYYSYDNISHLQNTVATLMAEYKTGGLSGSATFSEICQYPDAAISQPFTVHELTLNSAYRWAAPGLTFSVFYKWNGAQPLLGRDIGGSPVFSGKLPAYSMLDASVSRAFWKERVRIIAGAKNLFDVQVVSAGAAGSTGAHTTGGGATFIGRRLFSTLIVSL